MTRKIIHLRAGALTAALALAVSLLGPAAWAEAASEKLLVPLGQTVGIQLNTDGVLVVSFVSSQSQGDSPGARAGLLPGDLIVGLNDMAIHGSSDFKAAAAQLDGSPVTVTVIREGETLSLTLEPRMTESGAELGLWLRDGVTGIGTLTYYDPETGGYGGLGHSVNDLDSGVIIPIGGGHISLSSVTDIVKGSQGCPGELRGSFDNEGVLGSVAKNTVSGIFGQLAQGAPGADQAIPIAEASEIELGPAAVIANISGQEREEFAIEIVRIFREENSNRSLMIKVTDPDLIARAGGIVQGMSGSPIIQNGKLIGAVTHVLINDPTQGYGVFIENMLDAAA